MGRASVWLRALGASHALLFAGIAATSSSHAQDNELDSSPLDSLEHDPDATSDVSVPSSPGPARATPKTETYDTRRSAEVELAPGPGNLAQQPTAAGQNQQAAQVQQLPAVEPAGNNQWSPSAHWGSTRVLGSHSFLMGTFTPSGLVNSHLGVRAGLEYQQMPGYVQLPSLTNSGPQAVNLSTLNVAETIDFGIRLHDHFAIFGEGYGKARIGANINTLLGTGADYTYGGKLGVLVKLFRLSSFQVSVSGQAGYYTGQSAGILALFQDLNVIAREAVEQVQQNPVIDINRAVDKLNTAFRTATADLLTPFEGVTYGVSLNVAQAIGPYFGVQASFGYYAEAATYRPTRYDTASGGPLTQEHTVSTQRPSFGIAVDFAAMPAGVPLAILLEYRGTPTSVTDTQDVQKLDESSFEHLVALGLFYSGRTDLQLGITTYSVYGQLPTLHVGPTSDGKPLDLALQLVFRYFW